MTKIPAFQFYPADWRKDLGVQSLTFHERGIWFEILCLMHESETRGRLMVNGKPMPDETVARLIGADKQEFARCTSRLLELKVADRGSQGELINRRMIRDDELRLVRKEAGKKGGNPLLVNQNPNPLDNQTTEDEDVDEEKGNKGNARKAEPSFLNQLLDLLREYYGVVSLDDDYEWMQTADFAEKNKWKPIDVLDCLKFLKAETWRTGRVTPKTVRAALPDFMQARKPKPKTKTVSTRDLIAQEQAAARAEFAQ